MSLSFGSKKQTTTQSSQTDPWDETIPYLKDFLGNLGSSSTGIGTLSPDATTAINDLKDNGQAGSPYAAQADTLANDLFNTTSRAPQVEGAYSDYNSRLTPTANGQNLDVLGNPQLQKLLQSVGDDVQSRINSQFAGAGRDLSGINQQSVAKGVTAAQLPLILQQYNTEQGRTDAAARDLFAGGSSAATTEANLDQLSSQLRSLGIDVGDKALAEKNWGPEQVLKYEEILKTLPLDEQAQLAQLLFGAAGLGQQSSGTSTGKLSSSGFSISGDQAGKGISALSSLFLA